MSKRYQVFVSSTYADLKEERSKVIQTLMEMDCIPSGMELFPAADEEQFEFIKKVIDDCDYYLLIIGGRYGTVTSEGISFTEKEYDYAIEKGLKVIALVHDNPDIIPLGKTDKDADLANKLGAFRAKVRTNRLVKGWRTVEELPGIVSLSLSKTIKTYPAIGWVRGNHRASAETLEELNNLRKRNAELEAAMAATSPEEVVPNLADLNSVFQVSGHYRSKFGESKYSWKGAYSFGTLFSLIAPYLLEHPNDAVVKLKFARAIVESQGKTVYEADIDDQIFQTFKVQMTALGLVELQFTTTTKGGVALFWSLTKKGSKALVELRAVRN